MSLIHPTAIVAPGAQLGEGVEIGPYCTVGAQVRLGDGCRLISHAVVDGATELGRDCIVYPFASVGLKTQDKKFKGGTPRLRIGDRTTIREAATIHAATYDGDYTTVGSDCLIMDYAHVAHDCLIGNGVILANAVQLAGHVVIEDRAIVGGASAVHQFVRLGRISIIGGCSKVIKDVPPFALADGNPLSVHTINKIGMERAGLSAEAISTVKDAFRIIYRENLTAAKALEKIAAELPDMAELRTLSEFVKNSERGLTR